MSANQSIKVGLLKETELDEADRIVNLAFGTFLGVPNPLEFMGDRTFMKTRWRSSHVKVLAAHVDNRIIGTNVITRWGGFAFFGPLTVLPEYWNRGVAQRLLESTVKLFDRWDLRHTGLFTFAHSPKHVALYQKFGYWPCYLTAVMTRAPEPKSQPFDLLSAFAGRARKPIVNECRALTHRIDNGLDLTDEIRSTIVQRAGDVLLTRTRGRLDAFAVCLTGLGTEGGEKTCYVKFAAARSGAGAGERFDKLLDACDAFASSRGTTLEAGMNLAREDAYWRMRSHGFRVATQGVAMLRPHTCGYNRADVFVIDDWR